MEKVRIGDKFVGNGEPVFFVAEIGINHNGDLNLAKKLIDVAADSGCDAVKFQKRTLSVVYSKEELDRSRESPFGTTNRELKEALEFNREQYEDISRYAKQKNIVWFASCWDEQSVDFMEQLDPPCYKISSASLTDDSLLRHHRKYNRPIILSTGMSTLEEIDHAVDVLGTQDLVILHCNSSYPSVSEELNLRAIRTLQKRYGVPVGYSGHETGLATSLVSSVLGACMIERHITLDRAMWGTDQSASLEPQGIFRLVRDVRVVEKALGDGVKRVYDSELPVRKKLRRVG
jgi:N-acetylneuraminate synthase